MFGATCLRRQAPEAMPRQLARSHLVVVRHPLTDDCIARPGTATSAQALPVMSALAQQHLRAFREALPALFPQQATDQFGPLLIDRADPSALESLMRHVLQTGGNVQRLSFIRVTGANRAELRRDDSSCFRSAAMRRAGSVTVAVRSTQFLYMDTQLHGIRRLVEAMRLATADLNRVVGVSAFHRVWEGAEKGWRVVVETPEANALSAAQVTVESLSSYPTGRQEEPPKEQEHGASPRSLVAPATTSTRNTNAPNVRLWVKPRRVPGLQVLCAKSRAALVSSSQRIELYHREQLVMPSGLSGGVAGGHGFVERSAQGNKHYWGLTGAPLSLPWKRSSANEVRKNAQFDDGVVCDGDCGDGRRSSSSGDESCKRHSSDQQPCSIDTLSALEDAMLLRQNGAHGCHPSAAATTHHCWFRASELDYLNLAPLRGATPLRIRAKSTFVCVPLFVSSSVGGRGGSGGMHSDAIASLFRVFPLPSLPGSADSVMVTTRCFVLEYSTRSWRRMALTDCTFNFGHTTTAQVREAFTATECAEGGAGGKEEGTRVATADGRRSDVTLIELRLAVELGLIHSVSGVPTTARSVTVRRPASSDHAESSQSPNQQPLTPTPSSKPPPPQCDRKQDGEEESSALAMDAKNAAWGALRNPSLVSVLSSATFLPSSVIHDLLRRDGVANGSSTSVQPSFTREDVAEVQRDREDVEEGAKDDGLEEKEVEEEQYLQHDLLNIMLVECVDSAEVYHAVWVAPKTLSQYAVSL